MRADVGFFNVDTQEVSADGTSLVLRARVAPIADRIGRLLAFAAARGIRLVCTPCVNAGRVDRVLPPGAVFISDAPDGEAVERALRPCPAVWLERRNCGSPERNCAVRAFDIFTWNRNAERVMRGLGVPRWVVFGDSAGYCLRATVLGLVRLGAAVTIAGDAVGAGVDSARQAAAIMRELEGRGARVETAEEIMNRLGP